MFPLSKAKAEHGRGDKEMRGLKENGRIAFFLVLIAGVVSVPLMTDYVMGGNSLAATLSQIKVISTGIGKMFPIRLGTLGSLDYGYSAASFQGNVFMLFPAILHRLGMGIGSAYKWTLFVCNISTAVISYICFEKSFNRQEIGLIGSILYTWNHYRCSEMYLVGDLGEIVAWTFMPIILLGLKLMYTRSREDKAYGQIWVILTLGFSLIAVSSTVLLFAMAIVFIVFLCIMGKETLQKRTMLEVVKTGTATFLINAWFLIPMLLRMRDVSAVAPLLLKNVRDRGMYAVQYLTVFPGSGGGVGFVEEGIRNAQAMGPGIAVIMLVILGLWFLFVKTDSDMEGARARMIALLQKTLWVGLIVVILSTNMFPWDILQDKNMLFSIILAMMYTPAKLGVGAGVVLILAACMVLEIMAEWLEKRKFTILLLLTGAVSFGTTQFLLGNILFTRGFVRHENIESMCTIEFPLILQESMVWRLSEVLSCAAVGGLIVMWIIRRRKSVKRV